MILSDVPPARSARPGPVTVAFWLQLAAVAVLLVLVGLSAVDMVRYNALIDEVLRVVPDADPVEVSDERGGILFALIFLGAPALLLAGWFAATALPLRRGGEVARILTFVAAGAEVLIFLGQVCLVLVGMWLVPPVDPAEQSRFLNTLYARDDPALLTMPVAALSALLVFLLTAAVVLLLVPASRRWFRGRASFPPVDPWAAYPYRDASPGGPQADRS